MSAYLCSNDCLSALVTYWVAKTPNGRGRNELERALAFSYERNGDFIEAAVEAKALLSKGSIENVIFAILLDTNCDSLEARYPGDKDMQNTEGYHFKKSASVCSWLSDDETHHLVGLVDGYEYQSCEHNGWRTSTAWQIIQQIRSHLLNDFQSGSSEWASFKEPEKVQSPLKELARTQWGNEHLVIIEG